jgi:hypothetical protein
MGPMALIFGIALCCYAGGTHGQNHVQNNHDNLECDVARNNCHADMCLFSISEVGHDTMAARPRHAKQDQMAVTLDLHEPLGTRVPAWLRTRRLGS